MVQKPFVFITDSYPPEAIAMMQALYSRDPKSVLEHIQKVEEVGAEKFMSSYYVGYGHKSIGDCGSTTLFIEQVSLLAAKAFQEHPLYSGQEASTRYLDMSQQALRNPIGSVEGENIQKEWMSLYNSIKQALVPYLQSLFPLQEGQSEKIYEKAILAKSFDIARGFLPAGTTTLLAWHTNLRQAYDHIQRLHHHPLEEVRSVTDIIHTNLQEKYPSSFSHKFYEATEQYIHASMQELSYFHDVTIDSFSGKSLLESEELQQYETLLSTRPEKTELLPFFRKFGNLRFQFLLDFGSYRDLQRHRSGIIPMPLLTLEKGFHPWYISMLPPEITQEVLTKIETLSRRVEDLDCSPEVRQYYIPIGYQCTIEATLSLPAALYIAEIRSAQTVHPTLRVIAQQMSEYIKSEYPTVAVHADMTDDEWSIRRGGHDITKR